jgi:hypothetical protein
MAPITVCMKKGNFVLIKTTSKTFEEVKTKMVRFQF